MKKGMDATEKMAFKKILPKASHVERGGKHFFVFEGNSWPPSILEVTSFSCGLS